MEDYTRYLPYVVFHMIDRSVQKDNRSKIALEAAFENPVQAKECYAPSNKFIKRYIADVNSLEEFEDVYNAFQDLREAYGERAIFHLKELGMGCDKENKYRQILGVYTSIDF